MTIKPKPPWGMAKKPCEIKAPRQSISQGRVGKPIWVAQAIAGGELLFLLDLTISPKRS